jgi:hypothetical protein
MLTKGVDLVRATAFLGRRVLLSSRCALIVLYGMDHAFFAIVEAIVLSVSSFSALRSTPQAARHRMKCCLLCAGGPPPAPRHRGLPHPHLLLHQQQQQQQRQTRSRASPRRKPRPCPSPVHPAPTKWPREALLRVLLPPPPPLPPSLLLLQDALSHPRSRDRPLPLLPAHPRPRCLPPQRAAFPLWPQSTIGTASLRRRGLHDALAAVLKAAAHPPLSPHHASLIAGSPKRSWPSTAFSSQTAG